MFASMVVIAGVALMSGEGASSKKSMRDTVCEQRRNPLAGDKFSLLALPSEKRKNETGVLMLVNCSSSNIVSIRDTRSQRDRLTEFVYDKKVRRKVNSGDESYEFVNFNERAGTNVLGEMNIYSKNTYWRGPCKIDGLELTTSDPSAAGALKTITFSLNICDNFVLALVGP